MVPLSILDLSPVAAGSSGAVSLRNSLDLARLADRLGFTRYWVAEHHNLPSIASSAPDIMIGQIAAVTEHMRVGSGGVMLPNHAPLMVAERFKVLEALFPGRIDLGLGRAPGTDPVTSYALRRRQDAGGDDDFLQRFQELLLFESNGLSRRPSVSLRARHAGRRRAAADLAARIERLQRATRRHGRGRIFLRASFRRSRSGRADAELPRSVQAVGRRARRPTPFSLAPRFAPTATPRRTGSPPPSISTSCAAGAANTCRWRARRRPPPIPIRRPNAPDRAQPRPPVRRHAGDGAGAARRR